MVRKKKGKQPKGEGTSSQGDQADRPSQSSEDGQPKGQKQESRKPFEEQRSQQQTQPSERPQEPAQQQQLASETQQQQQAQQQQQQSMAQPQQQQGKKGRKKQSHEGQEKPSHTQAQPPQQPPERPQQPAQQQQQESMAQPQQQQGRKGRKKQSHEGQEKPSHQQQERGQPHQGDQQQRYQQQPERDEQSQRQPSAWQQRAQQQPPLTQPLPPPPQQTSAWQKPYQQPTPPHQQPPVTQPISLPPQQTSAWQKPYQQPIPPQQQPPIPQPISPPPQQTSPWQKPHQQPTPTPQGPGSQGRGKGRGQPIQAPVGKEFSPPPQQMQQPQQRGKGRTTTMESSVQGDGPATSVSGGRGQPPREAVREISSGMQQVSLSGGTRPVTAAGDAPTHLIPQTSSDARRGGKEGKFVTRVLTNFFPLNIGKLESAIHYDVAIVPDKPRKLLRQVMEEFRRKKYSKRYPAYDGNKNLYSSSALFESSEISDLVKVMEDEREKEFHVTVKFATLVDLTCLRNYTQNVRGRSALDLDKPMQALQCVDIVLRSAPALSCIPVGRSYFTRPNELYRLGDGAVLYNGFFQAAILGWKPFVNIDVANKAFPAAVNMIELLKEMSGEDLSRDIQRYAVDSINKHMKSLKIQYELPRNQASRRVYRVNELGPPSNRATFKDDTGRSMTVADYFKTKKNIQLRYPHLPTLWVGSRNRENKILLPLEFCTILPDQVVNKKMTEEQTRNMIRKAATDTRTRLSNISHSVSKANYNENPTMREFGLTVNPTPQEVEARILHPPMLEYYNKKENVSRGTWRASQFIQGASLTNWTVLCLDRRTREDNIHRLETDLMKTAKTLGMNITAPAQYSTLGDRNLQKDLRSYFAANKNFQMIIVILNVRSDCYSLVKEASEIAVGCLTQCIKSQTVYKLSASTVGNILLKINAKLNGENHHLQGLKAFLARPCMIMGADVTHPGPDSKDFPSVAAVTASFDAHFFKYAFEWRLQQARQEMIEDLQEITKQHLLNFYRKNHQVKPEKLIYVRDGVSDGQFEQVLNVELTAIRTACVRLQASYNPPIIFVVVQKRHHTRFFPKDPRISEDRNINVPAGTCVDTEITHPSIVDFYLVSHASIQGVAKPTKYVKLWDDCNMSEDDLEKLMYYLCHMFARCNRSVSYPAPTYYAHLAAARARVYCETDRIDMMNLDREQKRLTIKENISKGMPMFFV